MISMGAEDDVRFQRFLTAHHEAAHAVASLMRGGGELLSIIIEPTADCLGYTGFRTALCASGDRMFVTLAGPWAEARARWPLSSLDGEDADGGTFDDYLAAALLASSDGDSQAYEAVRTDEREMEIRTAQLSGITVSEFRQRQELAWGRELEGSWNVIQDVANMLLDGHTVTATDVRQLVDTVRTGSAEQVGYNRCHDTNGCP